VPAFPQESPDFRLKGKTVFVAKVGKAERLLIALRDRHWKQHRRFPAHSVRSQMEGQVDCDSFVEAVGEFEQASGGRNPQGFSPELPTILELNRRRNSSPQIDPGGTDLASRVGEVGHCVHYLTQP